LVPRAKPSLPLVAARAAGAAARAKVVKVATRMLAGVVFKMFQARMLWCCPSISPMTEEGM
jgi:hypothetical protein